MRQFLVFEYEALRFQSYSALTYNVDVSFAVTLCGIALGLCGLYIRAISFKALFGYVRVTLAETENQVLS